MVLTDLYTGINLAIIYRVTNQPHILANYAEYTSLIGWLVYLRCVTPSASLSLMMSNDARPPPPLPVLEDARN